MAKTRENTELVQRKFQEIAVNLSSAVPFAWNAIVLGIFLTGKENTTHIQLWAKQGQNGHYENLMKNLWDDDAFLECTERIQENCIALHQHCKKAHVDRREFSFVLLPDGSFTADFQYENIPEITSYFVAEWQSRFLI